MIPTSLSQLAEALDAELILPSLGGNVDASLSAQSRDNDGDAVIDHVSTDTRQLTAGSLFVALKGERFDAHQFVEQAAEKGASAILVHQLVESSLPQLLVKDTRLALGMLGAWVKSSLQPYTLALTGSCGKTTVKEMVASILSSRGAVLATNGNFNNDIGVPLTLLRLEGQHQYAVIELGANHLREIDYTAQLVKPQVALVNNIAEAHLEGFGSLEGVARAKGEIFDGLIEGGTAIVNLDSHGLPHWNDSLADKRVVTFSVSDESADFHAKNIRMDANAASIFDLHTPKGCVEVALSVPGQHNVANALAAAALAQEAGATLAQINAGLTAMNNVSGRVNVKHLCDQITVIDDTYNASVPAMRAAIDLLASYKHHRVLILGDMKELGKESAHLHQSIAEYAAMKHFDTVLTYGTDSRVISEMSSGHHFESKTDLIEHLLEKVALLSTDAMTILVKGGRSARMEDVVNALQETVQ